MFHLIPPGLHRLGLRLAHAARLGWWRVRRPVVLGCRVLAFDASGALLLVRHTYGSGSWMLPGGGLGRREDPLAAAVRECREETGCELVEAQLVAVIDEPLSGATNRVHVVSGRAIGAPVPDGREIAACGFYPLDALPTPLSAHLARELESWVAATR